MAEKEVTPAGPFWEAEPEHQGPSGADCANGYTCHFPAPGIPEVVPRRETRWVPRWASVRRGRLRFDRPLWVALCRCGAWPGPRAAPRRKPSTDRLQGRCRRKLRRCGDGDRLESPSSSTARRAIRSPGSRTPSPREQEAQGAEVRIRHVPELAWDFTHVPEPVLGQASLGGSRTAGGEPRGLGVGGRRRFRHSDAVRQRGGTAEAVHGPGREGSGRRGSRRQGVTRVACLNKTMFNPRVLTQPALLLFPAQPVVYRRSSNLAPGPSQPDQPVTTEPAEVGESTQTTTTKKRRRRGSRSGRNRRKAADRPEHTEEPERRAEAKPKRSNRDGGRAPLARPGAAPPHLARFPARQAPASSPSTSVSSASPFSRTTRSQRSTSSATRAGRSPGNISRAPSKRPSGDGGRVRRDWPGEERISLRRRDRHAGARGPQASTEDPGPPEPRRGAPRAGRQGSDEVEGRAADDRDLAARPLRRVCAQRRRLRRLTAPSRRAVPSPRHHQGRRPEEGRASSFARRPKVPRPRTSSATSASWSGSGRRSRTARRPSPRRRSSTRKRSCRSG